MAISARGGKRPGAGRPPKYGKAAMPNIIQIRCTNADLDAWKRRAREQEKILSDWARDGLNHLARS